MLGGALGLLTWAVRRSSSPSRSSRSRRRHRRELVWAALAGLALALVLSPLTFAHAGAALDAAIPAEGLIVGGVDLATAWPHLLRWWLLVLPVSPALAVAFDLLRPRSPERRLLN